jgi:putative membrane protein
MRSPRLAALELRRFARGRLPRAALVALLLLPLLYGALYLWSFWDPYSRLDRIPVALVNDDKGATADGKRIRAGDDIAEGLRDSKVFDWQEVSAEDARAGVEDGTYYLSLTMPADFSERVASSAGDAPETGALQVRTNDANNYIVGQISRTVFSEVRTAASTKTSRSFLDKIFISFSDIHGATEKAADGADKLKGGIGKAERGSKDLADGLKEAKSGSGSLSKGIKKLHTGAGDLEDGSAKVAEGTQALADKVNGYADQVGPFVRKNEKAIGKTAQAVADAAGAVRDNLDDLVERAPAAARNARDASDRLAGVYRTRCADPAPTPSGAVGGLLPEAGPDPACPDLKVAKDAAADVAAAAGDVETLAADGDGELKKLDQHLATLQKQAQALADRAPHLSEDLDDAVSKINELNEGAGKVAAGAKKLHSGLGTAKTGAKDLDDGIGELKTGANDLSGGLFKLVGGSGKLADGLHDGAERIPDYDERERDRRTAVMADPVQLVNQALHKAPNYGTGFAPYFIPLSLWVGAMVAYMVIAPLNRRALAAGASAWRIALAGWLPVVAVGVLQTAALMAVLHWAIGLHMARAAGTVAFLCLVTACFAAIVQWLNARFGAAGRILVLAVLMLQLTSAGGTYPVQTSPGFFNAVHPYLPMSHVVSALRRLISGGGLGPVWLACAVLAAFTAGALALTALSARRKQVWTLDRLHPELSL